MKEMIFNRIPASLFQPLAAPGAQYYSKCLQAFFELARSQGEPPSRERLVEAVLSVSKDPTNGNNGNASIEARKAFDQMELEEPLFGVDEDSPELERQVALAGAVIRYLVRCGWLQIEMHADFSQKFVFPDAAFRLLDLMTQISGPTENRFQGLICSIHDLLKAASEQSQSHVRVFEAAKQMQSLLSQLRELQHNIGRFLEQILLTESAKETLEVFFNSYATEVLEKAYHQLRTTDHLSRYRPNIEESLELLTEKICSASDSGVVRSAALDLGLSVEDARLKLEQALTGLAEAMTTIDHLLHSIDHRHSLFVDAAVRMLERKIMGSATVSGVVSASIEALIKSATVGIKSPDHSAPGSEGSECSEVSELPLEERVYQALLECVELTQVQHLSSESLTKPRKASIPFQVTRDSSKRPTKRQIAEAKSKTQKAVLKNIGRERIRNVAMLLLEIKNPTKASEIAIRGPEDLALLVYLRAYGSGELGYVSATIEPRLWIRKCGVGFQDFEISLVKGETKSEGSFPQ